MRNILRDLKAALHEFFSPWPEPLKDETTPEVIAKWIADHRHPEACRFGCQCEFREEV